MFENLDATALRTIPVVIGYALWVLLVFAWSIWDRISGVARTVATPAGGSSERASRWGSASPRERPSGLLIAFGLAMLVVAPVTMAGGAIWVNPILLSWGMLLVVAAGVGWCFWARFHLGRLWSAQVTRKTAHRVVDTGPYRLVRHPIYTGFIVIYAGLAILTATGAGIVGFAMMTAGLWLKARVEEQFLCEELGAAVYGSYKARTPMLVPRILRRPTSL